MTDPEDIDALAAEYVLGTLDAAERARTALRRSSDRVLDDAIAAWERRLAPLAETYAPVEPPAGLLAHIEARLDGPAVAAPVSATAIVLERRVRRWRWAAGMASAAAAVLLAMLGMSENYRRQASADYVAVFHKDFQKPNAPPSFLLTIDPTRQRLTIRRVAADARPGKSYQLWIVPQRDPVPRSLVLIPEDGTMSVSLAAYDPSVVAGATFGVSIEEHGGSRTGRPSPEVLLAQLIEASP
ncbi:MAG: anti-sigma factor [Hyphomicrobiaceae bacterium]